MNVKASTLFKGLTAKLPQVSIPESVSSRFTKLGSSFYSKSPQQLLVVEYDGFTLQAVIMAKTQPGMVMSHVSESHLPNAAKALDDVLSHFRAASITIPTKAVLLAPGVIPALLELPVSPNNPRPDFQMQELVKWELEPLVAEHTAVWPIEAILLGRGYLTYQQAQDIQAEIDQLKLHKRTVRFDELALQQGLVSRSQVDECMLIQETLQSIDDDLICGWSPQPASEDSDSGLYHWLACAMGRTQRTQWGKLFHKHGLELNWIFPLMGCSGAALNGLATTSTDLLVEVRPGLLGCTRISEGRVKAIRLYPTHGRLPSPAMVDSSMTAGTERVWLGGHDPQLPSLSESFRAMFDKPVEDIPLPPYPLIQDSSRLPTNWSALVGAGHYAFHIPGSVPTVAIPAQDPKPPIWKREEFGWMAAVGGATLIVLVLEIFLTVRLNSAQKTFDEVDSQLRKVETAVGKVQSRIDAVKKIEEKMAQRRNELESLQERQAFLQDRLPRRDRFVPALFDAITSSVSSEVLIDQVTEHDETDIEVNGWALTEQAAQQFAQNLGISLGPWGRTVVDFKVWDQTGRLGIQGYALSLQVTSTEDKSESAGETT